MGEGGGFYIDHKRNVIERAVFVANDKKAGMDLLELEQAIGALNSQPMVSKRGYKIKVTVGWKGQIQSISFEEADSVTAP